MIETRAVFDCNVLISAIGWGGNPRRCLDLVYGGQVKLFVTEDIWAEYIQKIPVVLSKMEIQVEPQTEIDAILHVATFVEPAPLGKQRSRDIKDERYLACAVSVLADAIVTSDKDLLSLQKPFGISVMSPVEFIKFVRGA